MSPEQPSIGYSRALSEDSAAWVDDVRRAESAGLAQVAAADMAGTDCFVDAALALASTNTVPVAISVALPVRSPLQTANAAASLERLRPGALRLGLGIGNAHLNREAHGVGFEPAVARMAEYLEAVRRLLVAPSGEMVSYQGKLIRATGPGLGCGSLPLLVGAHGPVMCRLAASAADGVILHIFTPLLVAAARISDIRARRPTGFAVSLGRVASVHPDRAVALRRARAEVASFLSIDRFLPRLAAGHGSAVADRFIQVLADDGIEEAAMALSESVVESFVTVAHPDTLSSELGRITGADVVIPVAPGAFTATHAGQFQLDHTDFLDARRRLREALLR